MTNEIAIFALSGLCISLGIAISILLYDIRVLKRMLIKYIFINTKLSYELASRINVEQRRKSIRVVGGMEKKDES